MTDLVVVPQPGDPHARCGTCPTCGPGPTEPHPRRAGVRCGNCKTHLTGARRVTLRIVKRERRAPDLHLPDAEEEAP